MQQRQKHTKLWEAFSPEMYAWNTQSVANLDRLRPALHSTPCATAAPSGEDKRRHHATGTSQLPMNSVCIPHLTRQSTSMSMAARDKPSPPSPPPPVAGAAA